MSRSSINRLLAGLSIALSLAGCASGGGAPAPPSRRTLRDGLNREVRVVESPQRIVSLAPNITEILFALGLGDRVIGVTSYCDYPAEARAKEKIGDTLRPDLERLIALRPDLVLVSTSSQLEDLTRRLDELAIPVYVTSPRTLEEVISSIRRLGEVTGARESASTLASGMEQRVAKVRAQVAGRPRPRVLYVLQTGPLITAGGKTFIDDLIRIAGGDSISAAETADYPQFSRETVIARAPEVIIAPMSHGAETVSESDLRRDYAATPAIRDDRILRIDPDLVDRPGPRLVEGLEQLATGFGPGRKQ
jgi:iron complex transport system substrate-binding protein